MREWLQDLRYGVRMILKRPGTSAIAIVALALGIGLTTTMFSIVQGVILRGLPFPESERIIIVSRATVQNPDRRDSPPPHDFADWRAQQKSFESLAGYSNQSVTLSGDSGFPERLRGSRMTPNTLAVLRVAPIVGRDFSEADAAPGAPPVALIGHRLWQARFKSDRSVAGTAIRLDGVMTTIVGVMPEKFGFPESQEIWLPVGVELPAKRGEGRFMRVIGRLRDGVTLARARAEMDGIVRQLASGPSGEQGHHRERDAVHRAGRSHANQDDVLHDAGRGARGDAHRLRQRDQPAAGTGRRAGERVRHPHRARLGTLANSAPVPGGRVGAFRDWRSARSGHRAVRRHVLHGRHRRHPTAVLDRRAPRSDGPRFRHRHHRRGRADLERGAGPPSVARGRDLSPERRHARRDQPADGPLQPLARRRRSRRLVHSARGVGPDDSQHPDHEPARLRLRHPRCVFRASVVRYAHPCGQSGRASRARTARGRDQARARRPAHRLLDRCAGHRLRAAVPARRPDVRQARRPAASGPDQRDARLLRCAWDLGPRRPAFDASRHGRRRSRRGRRRSVRRSAFRGRSGDRQAGAVRRRRQGAVDHDRRRGAELGGTAESGTGRRVDLSATGAERRAVGSRSWRGRATTRSP